MSTCDSAPRPRRAGWASGLLLGRPLVMKVARIGLTVLKGTRHQSHDEVTLSGQGPVGDRLFCLVDPRRRQVLRTVANGPLLGVVAEWQDDVLTVELGERTLRDVPRATGETLDVSYWGRPIRVDVVEGPWAEPFSHLLGQRVLLARARTGDVVYGGAVSITTAASLAALRVVSRDAPGVAESLPPRCHDARFRSTLVIDTTATSYDQPGSENAWVGHELVVGAATVRLTAPVVRCGVVDLDPVTGRRDLHLLDALPRSAAGEPVFGLQGEVTRPGLVRRGDAVLVPGL
jgi:uncharacterized protein YcbX